MGGFRAVAISEILGSGRFDQALRDLQGRYGGATITEPELEAGFTRWLPNSSNACRSELHTFFRQWFDTAYPTASGADKPTITGPGLPGAGFSAPGGCS